MLKLRSLSDHGFFVATLLCSLPLLGQQTSNTMLSATPTATSIGQAVSINVTVTGPSNTIPIPSGSVSFLDGSTSLGSVALSGLAVAKPIVVPFAQLFGAIPSLSMGTVLWAAFNGDGKSDLLSYGVISSTSDSVQVFLNNGDGTFTTPSSQNLGLGTISLIDFNGDGKLDLISPVSSSVEVSYGNGDGTFQAPIAAPGIVAPTSATPSTLAITPSTLAIADLTGTGVPYIILGDQTSSPGGEAPYASITIFKNNGNGNFTPLGSFPAGTVGSINSQTIKQIVPVDMNGDDILDLAVTMQTGIARGSYISAAVLLNQGSGTFTSAISTVGYTTCIECRASLVTGDFANRSKADIALLDINTNVIHLYPGNGDGTVGAAVNTPLLDNTYQLMTEDINGDGKLDIVESGGYAYLGNGDFTFTPTANLIKLGGLGFGGATAGSLIADFDGDSIPDILFNYRDSFGKQAAAVELGSRSAFAALPSITSLAVGVHPISADYAGDSIFAASASSIIDVTVSKYATTTTGSGTPNPVLSTQSSTLSVQVASSGPVPPARSHLPSAQLSLAQQLSTPRERHRSVWSSAQRARRT